MSKGSTVTICIPTYNQCDYLPISVRSAFNQTYPNIEVFVSDDGSTDNTQTVLAELAKEYPALRYYSHPKNLGISANNNWMLAQPNTEFILRLDSDDVLLPDYITRILPLMIEHENAAYGHAAVEGINELGMPLYKRRLNRPTGYVDGDTTLRASVSAYKVAVNIILFRRTVLHEMGFYRQGINFGEDYDLSIRIADAGYGNVYCDEILTKYRAWLDNGNVRFRRHSLQLSGYRRLYEESLQPAFERRGWSIKPIQAQRRKLALMNATFCYSNKYSDTEKAELVQLLTELGDSPLLRVKMFLLKYGLQPVIEGAEKFGGESRTAAKAAFLSLKDKLRATVSS